MARKELFTYPSRNGKTQIHAIKWMPDEGGCKAVLQLAHGMTEHIERYAGFAEYLTDRGFAVVGNDHLGHGESVNSYEEWGYFSEENPSDTVIEDMHKLREITGKASPEKPYFILGHSMGSYLLRKYISVYPEEKLAGIIVTGTGSVPDGTAKLAIGITKFLAKFKGWDYRSNFIKNLSYDKYYKQFDLTGKDPENSWLTRDAEIVTKYYAEPKCTYTFTLNGYLGLFEAVRFDNQQDNINKIPKELPVLIMSGAKDPVGGLGTGVTRVYEQYKAAGLQNLSFKLYEDARHEILNEINREEVYKDITEWLEENKEAN